MIAGLGVPALVQYSGCVDGVLAFRCQDADERAAHLPRWLHDYN